MELEDEVKEQVRQQVEEELTDQVRELCGVRLCLRYKRRESSCAKKWREK
jgi:hypothetical protein